MEKRGPGKWLTIDHDVAGFQELSDKEILRAAQGFLCCKDSDEDGENDRKERKNLLILSSILRLDYLKQLEQQPEATPMNSWEPAFIGIKEAILFLSNKQKISPRKQFSM